MFEKTPAFSGFSVDDIPAAKAFYGDVLGVRLSERDGMLVLHLAGDACSTRDTLVYPKPDHVPASFTILNFRVGDVDAAVDALVAKGVTFQVSDWTDERGVQRRYGPPIAWFTDPAGNVLSVIQDQGTG
jgi:catechol 2,3-dioxygenase-like lactoylglutathione lyase family enzyme